MKRHNEQGFTLLELLVCVAIVGVLIGFLLPAMRGARDAAKVTGCCANLRSLAQTTQTIATEQVPLPLAHEALTPTEMGIWDVPDGTWRCPADPLPASERSVSYSYVPGAFMADNGMLPDPLPTWQAWTAQLYRRYPGLPLFEDWEFVHSGATGRKIAVDAEVGIHIRTP